MPVNPSWQEMEFQEFYFGHVKFKMSIGIQVEVKEAVGLQV